jgi:hypothetical protein
VIRPSLNVARQDAVDTIRQRRQLIVRAITPLVLLAVLGGIALIGANEEDFAGETYRVAVQGDLAGASATLARLNSHAKLEIVEADDAVIAAANDAHIAVILPDALDASLTAGNDAELIIYETNTDKPSRAATAIVEGQLSEYWRGGSGATSRSDSLTLTVSDVESEDGGAQAVTGQLVSALVLLQGAILIGGAAARFTTRRGAGVLTTQLLLPLPRHRLVLGKGLAEMAVGLVAATPILALTALITATVYAAEDNLGGAGGAILAILVAAAVVAFPITALGMWIGAGARSPEQASIISALAVVGVAAIANFVSLSDDTPIRAVAALPIAGAAKVLRDVFDAGTTPAEVAAAIGSSLAFGLLIARVGGRTLDTERLALRAT